MTHTYAILKIRRGAYEEIKQKLVNAGYAHAVHLAFGLGTGVQPNDECVDMNGIAVQAEGPKENTRDRAQRLYEMMPDDNGYFTGSLEEIEDALHEERQAEFDEWQRAFINNGFNAADGEKLTYTHYVAQFALATIRADRRRRQYLFSQRQEIAELLDIYLKQEVTGVTSAKRMVDLVCHAIEEWEFKR